ncbi:hypothetical protein Nmel_018304 [Mimus melanotis]
MPPACPWRWPQEEVADERWCRSAERNRKLSNWTQERITIALRGSGVGSSWLQMLLPAEDETSRGGAAAPESGVLLSRGTELIWAQLNPSHLSELCHGFGQMLLSSNCSCSRAGLLRSKPRSGDCVPRQGPRCRDPRDPPTSLSCFPPAASAQGRRKTPCDTGRLPGRRSGASPCHRRSVGTRSPRRSRAA